MQRQTLNMVRSHLFMAISVTMTSSGGEENVWPVTQGTAIHVKVLDTW